MNNIEKNLNQQRIENKRQIDVNKNLVRKRKKICRRRSYKYSSIIKKVVKVNIDVKTMRSQKRTIEQEKKEHHGTDYKMYGEVIDEFSRMCHKM